MLTQEEKARRYDILSYALKLKLTRLKMKLAQELECDIDEIPMEELDNKIEEEVKRFIDDFFENQPAIFYLLDYMIYEQTDILPLAQNPYFRQSIQ